MIINLKDNQYEPVPWEKAASPNEAPDQRQLDLLREFAGVSLKELAGRGNFLIFPSKAAESELADQKYIYKLTNKDSDSPALQTGNIMGFISLGEDLQMRITSRFDQGKKNYFLHYMLQKVCNVAPTKEPTSSGDDEFYDFLYYLFPYYLNASCAQGIYRAYVRREYNDANVRGPIDVGRHIRFNIPFNGKIAYLAREYATDNNVTQLIRHTIEYIRSQNLGGAILEHDSQIRDNVKAMVAATPSYKKELRAQVIAGNLRPKVHSYYTAYEPLRQICLAILRRKKIGYGDNKRQNISGILFDGAALWEEYLARVFAEYDAKAATPNKLNLIHANNRLNKNGIPLFENGGSYYPDFYRKNFSEKLEQLSDYKGLVLDAKYKRLAKSSASIGEEDFCAQGQKVSIGREDLFQMLAYMHCLPATRAILLFPWEKEKAEEKSPFVSEAKSARGFGGEILAMGLPIAQGQENFQEFAQKMQKQEELFCEKIMDKSA